MKKIIEYKFAKKVSMIYMLFIALTCLMIILCFGGFNDGNWGLWGVLTGVIPEFIESVFNIDTHGIAPFMIIATVVIKVLDYIFTVINYDGETGRVKYPWLKHKVFNILGLIALPAWTFLAGLIFYGWCWFIADQFLGAEALEIVFIVPTILVSSCSLLIDLHGLKAKKHEDRQGHGDTQTNEYRTK